MINKYCNNCRSSFRLNKRICPNCKRALSQLRVRTVNQEGRTVSRVVGSIKEAEQALEELQASFTSPFKKAQQITLDEGFDNLIDHSCQIKATWRDDINRYSYVSPSLGKLKMSTIRPMDIQGLMSGLPGHLSNGSRRHILQICSRVFSYNKSMLLFSGDNPCTAITKPRVIDSAVRWLTPEEDTRLMKVLNNYPDQRPVLCLLFLKYTGLRRGEMLSLEWSRVDLTSGIIHLSHTKSGHSRSLPISKPAIVVLQKANKELRVGDSKLCFPSIKGRDYTASFKRLWPLIRTEAKLDNFKIHNLRSNFACKLVSSGVSIFEVQSLLGHRTIAMTMKYAFLQPDKLRSALEAIE